MNAAFCQGKTRGFFAFTFGVIGAVLALVLAVTPMSNAQVVKGSISGYVVDAQGGVVPDAAVKATNAATGETGTAVTDKNGEFRLNLLSIGSYKLEISKQGFRKYLQSGVVVSSGQDTGLGSVRLEVGDIATTVEVSGSTPLIQQSEAQISTNFTPSTIASLPGLQENQGLDSMALYVPGVSSTRDAGFSNTNSPMGFAVEGIRGRNNDQQIDGQNNNDNSVGGPGLFLSDTEFVQEYQLTTNNFSAEYGRNSGSVVNVITKSGTNNVHGSIYGTEGNSALDSLSNTDKEFEGLTKPPHYNDTFVGATIGGPMVKDHLFYFGGFDTEIEPQTSVYSSGSLTPTPAGIGALEGCYPTAGGGVSTSLQTLALYGPYGITAGNPTPQSPSIHYYDNPTVSNGTDPNTGDPACLVEEGGVQRTLSTGLHSYNWVYKMDLNTEKNRFYGRYIYNKSTFFNNDPFGTGASGYPASVPAFSQAYGFSWVRTLSMRMANEFRASYGRLTVGFGGNSIGNTVPLDTGISEALAHVSIGSANLAYGPATNAPQGRIVNNYQFQDNWTYILGRHAMKAGVNFTYQRSPNYFLPNYNGSFSFSNWGTYAQNTPSSVSITLGNPVLDFREKDTFLYYQDDFKVKNNLTLNLGVTWSLYGQPANLFHDLTTKQQSGSEPFWDPSLPTSVTTFPSIPAPKNSVGPNIGFAWTPGGDKWYTGHGKTTLRGGYRYSYDPPFYNIYLNIASAAPNVLALTVAAPSGTTLPTGTYGLGITPGDSTNSVFTAPFGPAVRTQFGPQLTTGVSDPRSFSQTTITPNFGPQKTHRWSFNIQRELSPAAVLEVGYAGNHAGNLFQSINQNPYIAGIAADFPNLLPSGVTPCPAANAVVPRATGRVSCDLGVVRQRTNTAYSDYEGVHVELRTNNLWHQLSLKTNYTFSKTTDNADEIFGTFAGGGTLAFSQNPLDYTNAEHGLSGLDFPNQFTLLAHEDLPFFRSQHGPIGHILGGWSVAAAYILSSGQTYTAQQFALNYFSGSPYEDVTFNTGFAGTYDTVRPFLGNPSAPATQVGMYAGDACNYFGSGCALDPTTLLNFNQLNTTGTVTTVTKNDVRFIVNGYEADQINGTPFGNVGRNTLRDAGTNNVNLGIYKTVKFWERASVEWHMTFLNAFNHPQYSSVDAFVDDAGYQQEGTGFADPSLTSGGIRSIKFGLRILF